ncbi:hypothetical protein N7472_004644 [Penicillium cf. griseofulvum]|uniref:Uncharacterized protein n=1 Tax=Penicillium cf. griseofulvum TaxID=2972120 RepID=A0A9W9JRZ4_9EURO|nr:hypothetical protein N7472_004644 [Penicillium cf. griseofulvum]KAJ5442202.1 hypothetical protein N7445_005209 [Penicillium cf. griseofulvum]
MESPATHIISIIGPTAVGKTKLGVYLAKVFCSDVISVDSLQCYKNGSMVTAKVTPSEADGVIHHLVDYLDADEEPHSFVQDALDCVKDIQNRGKVPILVGGSTSLTIPLLRACVENGKNVFVIMLDCPGPILQYRIEKRVDLMMEDGLLQELAELCTHEATYLEKGPDFSRGIWKAIGYQEFYPCLTQSGVDSKLLPETIAKCVTKMKLNSVFYAKSQLDWSQESLIPFLKKDGIPYTKLQVEEAASLENVMVAATRACIPILSKQYIKIERVAVLSREALH